MSGIILHHYPTSPFSEKVRLVLGYKQLAWRSVIIPAVMPKPDVLALTGGYRKTPFLQIGSDVYCDSALICDVLEHRQATPTLYPAHQGGVARVVAQWADTTLFWAAMAYNLQPKGAAAMFEGAPPELAKAFGVDVPTAKRLIKDPLYCYPGGNSFFDLYVDVIDGLHQMGDAHQGQVACLYTHSSTLRALMIYLDPRPFHEAFTEYS